MSSCTLSVLPSAPPVPILCCVSRTDRAAASCEVPAARPIAGAPVPCTAVMSCVQRREVHLGDGLVATAPSQMATQREAARPAKERHDRLPVTAQQQQQRDADEESNRRRSTHRRSTVLSGDDIGNGGEVDQVDGVQQVNIFVGTVHHRGLLRVCSLREVFAALLRARAEVWSASPRTSSIGSGAWLRGTPFSSKANERRLGILSANIPGETRLRGASAAPQLPAARQTIWLRTTSRRC